MLNIIERNKLKMELYKSGVSEARQREIIRMLEADEEQRFLLDIRSEYGDEDLWVLIFRSYVYGVKIEKMSMFNELIPEVKELLEADKEQYPFLYKTIVADLQKAQLSTDVKVSTANALIGYAEAAKVKFESDNFVLKLYNVFGR